MTEPEHTALDRAALYLSTFLFGAIVMAFEMIASRFLNPFFGSSIYTWGGLIAVMLAGMALGYYLSGRLADRYPRPLGLALLIAPAPVWMAVLPFFADSVSLFVVQAVPDLRLAVIVCSMLLFFVPVMLLSAASPYALRLLIPSTAEAGRIAGQVTGLSTVGSIVGTLGAVMILIPNLGTKTITWSLAAAAVITILIVLTPHLARRAGVAMAALALAILTLPHPAHAITMDELRDNLIEEVESPYNQIYVFKRGDLVSMKFGLYETRYTESVSNVADPADMPLRYLQVMSLGLACAQKAERMAMVGLGGGTLPRYLHHFMPEALMESAEIDPEVIRLAKAHFGYADAPNLRALEQDGRVFLVRAAEPYDVIFLDAYRGWFVPFHLTTREFYELVKAKLTPGGCAVQNVDPSTLLFDATMATMSAVFPRVDIFEAGGNLIVIGSLDPARAPETWRANAEALQARYNFRYPLADLISAQTTRDWDRSKAPLTDDFAPAEMLNSIERGNTPPRP